MAKNKRKTARTPLAVETATPKAPAKPKQELIYIGRKRETSVAGIAFELNKPVYVGNKALYEKLSKNPFFKIVE